MKINIQAINILVIVLAIYTQLFGGIIINTLVVGALLLYAIFDLIFCILGMIGISLKRKDLISYYYTGLYISLVFISLFLLSILLMNNETCKSVKPSTNEHGELEFSCKLKDIIYLFSYTFIPVIVLNHLVLLIYGYVFDKIYKNDLGNFII